MTLSQAARLVVALGLFAVLLPARPGVGRAEDPPARTGAAGVPGEIGFVGHNLFGDAPGVFHAWRVVGRSIDLANPTASQATVEVDLASVDTRSKGRDDHLRTADFFDVAKHPTATVRGHSPRALAPGPSGRPRYALAFDVDLHGTMKTVGGELEIVETSPALVVEGGFTLLRTDFGVGARPSRWNPMSIDDEVPVRFRIAFE